MKNFFSATKSYLVYSFVVIFVALQDLAIACPNCKEGFDENTTQAGLGSAYSITICLLLIVPIAIVMTIAIKIRRQMKLHEQLHLYTVRR